jgi:4-amino-4-deoxy-L-arabinose transferase-like glycosyltransferase
MRPFVAQSGSRAYVFFFCLFLLVLLGSHAMVLDLPYFWDELGQFVPAALDIREQGAWVPKSTLPNVHPPGVMAYLAAVWTVTGYSVEITRIAMLLLATAGVLFVFALGIELCRGLTGTPALIAVMLLLASPLFWAQSMMVQLDMPAMVLTALSLLLFVRGRYFACALASTALVLAKETSLVVPAVFGVWLLVERRVREALLFFLPAAALAAWLWVLYQSTGHVFGNQEFTHYNVSFQLHPVRLPLTILRRVFYLFVDNFHWVGTVAILLAFRKTSIFRSRSWAVVGIVAGIQTFVVSVLGGAALERYVLPVIPLFYIAVAAAWTTLSLRWRRISTVAMVVGLMLGIFINSPFPFPFENNAAFVSFVRLQQRAASYVKEEYPHARIASAWPFPDALRRPEFGFVDGRIACRGIDSFNPESVLALAGEVDVLVVYSRTWEPDWGVFSTDWIRQFLANYYFYSPQVTREQIESSLGLSRVARWEKGGQWIEVYARRQFPNTLTL